MSHKDRLSAFAEQAGFTIRVSDYVVVAESVPCLLRNGSGTCTIEKSFDPASGKPDKRIGEAVHAVRVTPSEAQDGRVYNADRTPIGNPIGGDGQTWSATSIRLGSPQSPTDDLSARDVVHRYAKHIVGAVAAADSQERTATDAEGPFKIPNTFEGRAGLRTVQDRIRDQSIAIVGLGGTGAYVLDLLAKTPVPEIHLLDADKLEWHNFMRAPGAPSDEEVESRKAGPLSKVDYYRSKYACFRKGVFVHPVRVDSVDRMTEFLARHPVDFAFVCIDQRKDGESPRQDVVYEALSLGNVPFIDSGISISVDGDRIRGAVTTGFYAAGCLSWRVGVPNARVHGDVPGYRNVQLPEINALAASLAVMEWRRRTEQYVSESASHLHKFRLEKPRVRVPTPE